MPADIVIIPLFGSFRVCFFIALYAPLALKDEVNCKFSNLRKISELNLEDSLFALTNGVLIILPFNLFEVSKIFSKVSSISLL